MHNLDTTAGQTSFADARSDAWHQLGQSGLGTMDARTAMEKALLADWNVRKLPLTTVDENGEMIELEGRAAVVRTNPVDQSTNPLGIVSDTYRIIQNEEHADFLNTLVDESGAHFETAGALDGGKKVFLTMKLPGGMKVGGVDLVDNYIAAVNSHDGSMAFTVMVTPVRVVCQNTLNVALGNHRSVFRVRHTSGATAAIQQARETLGLTFDYLDGFQEQAERLINTTMTQQRFEEIIETAFMPPEDAPASVITRWENKIETMAELFSESYTHEGIRETAWAGFNALAEYYDHFSATRGDDVVRNRAMKAVLDPGYKNSALELILQNV